MCIKYILSDLNNQELINLAKKDTKRVGDTMLTFICAARELCIGRGLNYE